MARPHAGHRADGAYWRDFFWVDSHYPALLQRYRAGTQIQAAGSLTFGQVYPVDRSMALTTRVSRTAMNWLDANRAGMTLAFLFLAPRR